MNSLLFYSDESIVKSSDYRPEFFENQPVRIQGPSSQSSQIMSSQPIHNTTDQTTRVAHSFTKYDEQQPLTSNVNHVCNKHIKQFILKYYLHLSLS